MTSQWLYCQSQDKRKPPARAHVENRWLKATCTPLLCKLCYLTEGEFATLKLLKQSTISGVYDTGKQIQTILNGCAIHLLAKLTKSTMAFLITLCPSSVYLLDCRLEDFFFFKKSTTIFRGLLYQFFLINFFINNSSRVHVGEHKWRRKGVYTIHSDLLYEYEAVTTQKLFE